MPKVEKSKKARARQQRVAKEFQKWLKENPDAGTRQKIRRLDAISDSAILDEELKKRGREKSHSSA